MTPLNIETTSWAVAPQQIIGDNVKMRLRPLTNVGVQSRPFYLGDVISVNTEVKEIAPERKIPEYHPHHLALVEMALYILRPCVRPRNQKRTGRPT